ncbi:MAG TPA: MFS transporter [Gammaproteobacteria bacterium]|nr:MFS transporter [Gammaproteobacteria bacterium]
MRFYHVHHAPATVAARGPGLAQFAPLYAVILVAYIGYAMTVTIFVPMLLDPATRLVPPDASRSLRTVIAGILMALYPTGQFFGSPIVGALSDRLGRKKVLSVSLVCSMGFYAVIAIALWRQELWLLMGACFFAGLCEADVAIAQSSIADRAAPEERGRYFGFIFAFLSLGYIVGPLGGGWLSTVAGYAAPFWAMLLLLALTFLAVRFFFRGSPPAHPDDHASPLREFSNLRNVFTDRRIRALNLSNFLLFLGLFGFFRVITVVMYDAFGITSQNRMMSYYAYLAAMGMIANIFFVGPLTRRFSLRAVTLVALAVGAAGYLLAGLPWGHRPFELLWISPIAAIAPCIAIACACALLSVSVGPEEQGAVMGNNQALQNGAEAISAVGLPAIAALGMNSIFGSGLSLYVAAAMMLLSLAVLALARSKRVRADAAEGATPETT